MEKEKPSKAKQTRKKKAIPISELAKLAGPAPEPIELNVPKAKRLASLISPKGATPAIQTVIYIHGIGNHPLEHELKMAWDQALFGNHLGDRSRMAYWVNRARYKKPPKELWKLSLAAQSPFGVLPGEIEPPIDEQINALTDNALLQEWLQGVANEVEEAEEQILTNDELIKQLKANPKSFGGSRAKFIEDVLLNKPTFRLLLNTFLPDVFDFFFQPQDRERMENSLLNCLQSGGGPFLIIGHSQGSMIAYNVLRRLAKDEIDVPLFITIGSPLGLQNVTAMFQAWTGTDKLPFPPCVKRWVNVANLGDIVAADEDLDDEFNHQGKMENFKGIYPNMGPSLHDAAGYLKSPPVQDEVRIVAGTTFARTLGKSIIMNDLVADYEKYGYDARLPVLIQMKSKPEGTPSPENFDNMKAAMVQKLGEIVEANGAKMKEARIEPLKRFVAAELTRGEAEVLRTLYPDLHIDKIWRDAVKTTQIYQSTNTIQAKPANASYHALGEGIGWAVLDTGIQADHPHFSQYKNIVAQWDCTRHGPPVETPVNDVYGHGTHVAGIIAGMLTLPKTETENEQTFAGMAPAASIYGFKVLDDYGDGQDSYIIKALDYIADLNECAGYTVIHGVNLSLGGNFDPTVYGCGHTPLCQELRRLWGQGVLVCIAAGNDGVAALRGNSGFWLDDEEDSFVQSNLDFSINDPANLDEAIAVGSVHKENPYTYGISYFSSRGPTADGRNKPDLVAPGEKILSAWNRFHPEATPPSEGHAEPGTATWEMNDLYVEASGTSMAAPHVSGILAAFLSVRKEFIARPDQVKQILLENCSDLGRDRYTQGAGIPNLMRMLANT